MKYLMTSPVTSANFSSMRFSATITSLLMPNFKENALKEPYLFLLRSNQCLVVPRGAALHKVNFRCHLLKKKFKPTNEVKNN